MLNIVLSLLSGLLGAIAAALLYGRVTVRGIERHIKAALTLNSRKEVLDTLSSLTALKSEIEQNMRLTEAAYKQYFPLALSNDIWLVQVGRLHGLVPEHLRILTSVYLLVAKIKACDESVRAVTSLNASLPEYIEMEALWAQLRKELEWARNVVDGAIDTNKKALAAIDEV